MFGRVKNLADAIFFTPDVCDEAPQTSCDRIGETLSGLSPRAAALASGVVGKSEEIDWSRSWNAPEKRKCRTKYCNEICSSYDTAARRPAVLLLCEI